MKFFDPSFFFTVFLKALPSSFNIHTCLKKGLTYNTAYVKFVYSLQFEVWFKT